MAALLVLGGCGGSDRDSAGQPAAHAVGGQLHESSLAALASTKLADGRRIELRAARDDAGPCLMVQGVDELRRGCGRPPSARRPAVRAPIVAEAIVRKAQSAPVEVYGATAPNVVDVDVAFIEDGRPEERTATLLTVTGAALRRARVDAAPFGYFLAELPSKASAIRAVALDGDGAELGAVDYAAMEGLHPRAFIAEEIVAPGG